MGKYKENEFCLLLVLINYISILGIGIDIFNPLPIIMRILFVVIIGVLLAINYLIQLFMWTGEDKMSYDVERNNQSHLLLWLCLLIVYTIAIFVFDEKYKGFFCTSGMLFAIFSCIRLEFLEKNEQCYFENSDFIDEYSLNISFLLFLHGLCICIFSWLFLNFTIKNLICATTVTVSSFFVMLFHVKNMDNKIICKEFFIYIFECIIGSFGMIAAKLVAVDLLCYIVLLFTLSLFFWGISELSKKEKDNRYEQN